MWTVLSWGPWWCRAEGGRHVGLEGAAEGLAGDADADEEIAFEHGVVGVEVGVAHIEAGAELAGVEEVVVAADVVSVEHLGGGVLAEEGEWAGVCTELLTRMATGLK
jgi:hypothetical protein